MVLECNVCAVSLTDGMICGMEYYDKSRDFRIKKGKKKEKLCLKITNVSRSLESASRFTITMLIPY